MRALYVTSELGLRGGERQGLLLARHVEAHGVKVALCAPRLAELHQHWRGKRFDAPMANAIDRRGTWAIRAAVRAFQPDLVHVFTSRAHALARGALDDRPLVVTRSVAFPAGRSLGGAAKYRRGVAAFIAVSSAVEQALIAVGTPRDRIRRIWPGVEPLEPDPEGRARIRAELGLGAIFVAVGVGALEPTKGFDLALRAIAGIDGAALVIAGEGAERPRLERLAGELGVSARIRLLGRRADLADVLAAADAFILSSRSEGFGMALVEAMGLGLPCAVADCGGVRDIVTGERDALLVPRDDPEALRTALARIRAEPDLAARLGGAAKVRARGFTPERMASETLAVYREVVEGSPP